MKVCLVATFPPSGRQLNEYAYYIARELQANPEIELLAEHAGTADHREEIDRDPLRWLGFFEARHGGPPRPDTHGTRTDPRTMRCATQELGSVPARRSGR